jgi:hypothetical protein
MSQRERARRRLRQLTQREPAALLYPCVPADFARRHLPPDVVAQTTEAACTVCRVAVLAHTPVLTSMRELADRVGRQLAMLCQDCGAALDLGAEHMELRFIDGRVAARLDEWEAQRN